MKCAECKYFKAHDANAIEAGGVCFFNPPQVFVFPVSNAALEIAGRKGAQLQAFSFSPPVQSESFCSQFSPKQELIQ